MKIVDLLICLALIAALLVVALFSPGILDDTGMEA